MSLSMIFSMQLHLHKYNYNINNTGTYSSLRDRISNCTGVEIDDELLVLSQANCVYEQ